MFSELSIAVHRLFLLARLKLIGNLPVGILLFFYIKKIFVIDYKFKSHSWCYCEVAFQAQEFVVKLRKKQHIWNDKSCSKNKNVA